MTYNVNDPPPVVRRFLKWAPLLLTATLLSGCSNQPRPYPAAGQVVFADGKPLPSGRIELRSVEHPIVARGSVNKDGSFQLTTFKTNDGAIAGKHTVLIVQKFSGEIDNMAEHAKHASRVRTLNPKHASYATSGLELSIDPKGDNSNLKIEVTEK